MAGTHTFDRDRGTDKGKRSSGGSTTIIAQGWNEFTAVTEGSWWNCSGGVGNDRGRMLIAMGEDGPCITVPFGQVKSSKKTEDYHAWNSSHHRRFERWSRC